MIWNQFEDEENILFVENKTRSFFPYAPPTPSFKFDGLTTATQTGISESISRGTQATVGYGIIGLGLAVFLGTRGAGYKPAGIIMDTGLQIVGEAYE